MINTNYKFSFTATSLRTKDLIAIAGWDESQNTEDLYMKVGNGKLATGQRIVKELKYRLKTLTKMELSILENSSYKAQNEIAYLATCKYYNFIRDFVVEVIRDKYIVYDYEISDGDYLTFFRTKETYYPKMSSLTDNTKYKLRQVIFRILEEAKIINDTKSRIIQSQILETEVEKAIIYDDPELLKVFLLNDNYINQLTSAYA